jgi:hypothetical protein
MKMKYLHTWGSRDYQYGIRWFDLEFSHFPIDVYWTRGFKGFRLAHGDNHQILPRWIELA